MDGLHDLRGRGVRRLRRTVIAAFVIVVGTAIAADGAATAAPLESRGTADERSAPAAQGDIGEPTPPEALGDDPLLDALAQLCYSGDLAACDTLYQQSAVASAYEGYGSTCGGRLAVGTSGRCLVRYGEFGGGGIATAAPTLPAPTILPTGLGSDAEQDQAAQECYDGALLSCDRLYFLSTSGSAYADYADTCAGRQPPESGRYCHEMVRFPPPARSLDDLPDDVFSTYQAALFCSAGDMAACDELYREAGADSPFLAFAETCAGRLPEGSAQYCEAAFPQWLQLRAPSAGTAADTGVGQLGTPTDPATLGDDVTFDGLADSCYRGDLAACDTLYVRTPVGSTYEAYGATCGGRLTEAVNSQCVSTFGDVAPDISMQPSQLPAATLQPTGLGTDPALDALAQSCASGSMYACDALWWRAPEGSGYESFADTCAGRQPPETGYCHVLVGFPPPAASVTDLPDDKALSDLSDDCNIGHMVTCDQLYRVAPFDSPYHAFADTCGGRQPEGTGRSCRSAFPQWEALLGGTA